jgi:thioredoxin-related protein
MCWPFRSLAVRLLGLVLLVSTSLSADDPVRDPREYFFSPTFGDLLEELDEARDAGKLGLFLFFEQEGCPYCEAMMRKVLNRAAVQDWYRERFVPIAVDINGSVELRDVDGVTLPAKAFADHRKVSTTPTMSFIDLNGTEVYRRSTMVKTPEEFLMMSRYVAEGHYTDTTLRDFEREQDLVEPVSEPVPIVHDLRRQAARASTQGQVVLLSVTREGCSYCAVLRREVLAPMIRSGEYEPQVSIRELRMEPDMPVIGFSGEATSSARIAARYGVDITPTVLFLDTAGNPLRPAIVGINNVEMYGFYLDQAIAEAVERLRPVAEE